VGRRRFRCTKVHKSVKPADAIVQSCNVFFYDWRAAGHDESHGKSPRAGVGAPSGLGLNNEQAASCPPRMAPAPRPPPAARVKAS